MCVSAQGDQEIGSPGAGVTGTCEPPYVSTKN